MRKLDLKIDVTAACRTEERIDCAVTVIAPEPAELRSAPVVMFGWPGGGYNRSYFDLHVAGAEGYSQAEFHAGAGVIFVACDHVAVGDSTVPNAGLDHPDIARANRAVVAALVEELRNGALLEGLGPVEPAAVIGMGQSYGGLLLTLAEANEPIFDGVAMLGWSGINTTPPAPMVGCPGWNELAANGATHPYRRAFHYDDVPESIVVPDLCGYPLRALGEPIPPWGARWMPGGPNAKITTEEVVGPGVVEAEAAKITCAVFIANGERDVCPDPRLEPTAYRRSPDITTFILPRASHMHNFAGTRKRLWRKLEAWSAGLIKAD